MSTADILNEIERMPLREKLSLLEKTIKDIIRQTNENEMSIAAESLENEYKSNADLTAFSNLDTEDFYETK